MRGRRPLTYKKRVQWGIKPVTKPHSTRKGKKGYKREKVTEVIKKEEGSWEAGKNPESRIQKQEGGKKKIRKGGFMKRIVLSFIVIAVTLFSITTFAAEGTKKGGEKPVNKNPVVAIEMDKGNIVFEMYPDIAPKTVERISYLVESGFYNGLIFHRVVPGFVIQGGDPRGNGTGGSGVKIPAEFNKKPHITGTVAMARATDPNSADSQFYICLAPQPSLDGNYTVFGQVTEGMDVVQKVRVGDVMKKVTLKK